MEIINDVSINSSLMYCKSCEQNAHRHTKSQIDRNRTLLSKKKTRQKPASMKFQWAIIILLKYSIDWIVCFWARAIRLNWIIKLARFKWIDSTEFVFAFEIALKWIFIVFIVVFFYSWDDSIGEKLCFHQIALKSLMYIKEELNSS